MTANAMTMLSTPIPDSSAQKANPATTRSRITCNAMTAYATFSSLLSRFKRGFPVQLTSNEAYLLIISNKWTFVNIRIIE
jgi:hypothetical protein